MHKVIHFSYLPSHHPISKYPCVEELSEYIGMSGTRSLINILTHLYLNIQENTHYYSYQAGELVLTNLNKTEYRVENLASAHFKDSYVDVELKSILCKIKYPCIGGSRYLKYLIKASDGVQFTANFKRETEWCFGIERLK